MAYDTRDPMQLVQTISTNIQKITQSTSEIQRIVNQLGTALDTAELRHQLQQKIQFVNKLAKDTDVCLKNFTSLPADSDQRQRKLQKDRLLNEFSSALTNFQKIQRQAAEKEKEFVARVRAGSRLSAGGADDGLRDGALVNWNNESQSQVMQEDDITEDDLRLIEERESSILQLEEDIRGINEIFKDLGMMVHEQGEMIDSIEANVESADVHVQQANQQLARAAEYQRKSRKKICIIVVVLLILAVVLGLIIWGATKN
ncbi:syntaxin-7 [Rana temporaria]|uniref:syntaxin-7 n=1 Tax=Rana temporaria TaxID=8407 RepID=UPI001AACDFFE|nr:syntaxin-7 [Rana temporaria]XP_040188627.1 syntaxin-7 [Rana temporaria]